MHVPKREPNGSSNPDHAAHLELIRLSDGSQHFALVRAIASIAPPLRPSLATGEEVNVADCEAKQTGASAVWTSSCGAVAWAV